MRLLLVVSILLVLANCEYYDALFDVFNAIYFSPGLQFQTHDPDYPIAWTEGNLELTSFISCNKSTDGLKTDCNLSFKTGTIILQPKEGSGDPVRMVGCKVSATVTEVDEGSKYLLGISSVDVTFCEKRSMDPQVLAEILRKTVGFLSFEYDKNIDTYPVQPVKDDAMKQIFGYMMHSKGIL